MAAVHYIQLTRSDMSIPGEYTDACSGRVRRANQAAGSQVQQLADTKRGPGQPGFNLEREVQQPV
jgi:hypothetical protein